MHQSLRGSHDSDSLILMQHQQVLVTGHNKVCMSTDSARENMIVIRIAAHRHR